MQTSYKIALTAALCAAFEGVALAGTVGWWPLAYENGVRTSTSTVFENRANRGTFDATPISLNDGSITDGSESCPQGTNAFPRAGACGFRRPVWR